MSIKTINIDWFMIFSLWFLGVTMTEVYNYFIKTEYTGFYLFICIWSSIGSFLWFYIQYKNYNKDV